LITIPKSGALPDFPKDPDQKKPIPRRLMLFTIPIVSVIEMGMRVPDLANLPVSQQPSGRSSRHPMLDLPPHPVSGSAIK
jgi:hypothetical protein